MLHYPTKIIEPWQMCCSRPFAVLQMVCVVVKLNKKQRVKNEEISVGLGDIEGEVEHTAC